MESWQPIGPPLHDILDFAFNRQNPRVIFAASRDSGVFRTTDGGSSWTKMNNGLTSAFIRSIEVHPTDSNIVLAGTINAGIFWSGDGGNSWYPTFLPGDSTILSIAFDELHPDTVYASTNRQGLFRSTTTGASWERITPDSLGVLAYRVFVDPQKSNQLTCLFPDSRRIYRSEDYGTSWSRFYQGRSVLALAENPLDDNTIYIGTTPADSIRRTRNHGVSWKGLPLSTTINDIVVNPADTAQVYVASPALGVLTSTNSGESWFAMNSGLSSIQVIRLKLEPGNPAVL